MSMCLRNQIILASKIKEQANKQTMAVFKNNILPVDIINTSV